MAIGDIITAARYNSIKNMLHTVLGTTNSGSVGYGQYVVSSSKTSNDIVDHSDMVDLYIDLSRARAHQTGNPPQWTATDGLDSPDTDDIVGEFAAALGATNSSDATTNLNMGYVDFESASNDVQTNVSTYSLNQMSQEVLTTNSRTSIWNGTITHIVTLAFSGYTIPLPDGTTETVDGADHRRYFFNTGGNVQFTANITGGNTSISGTKDYNWQVMLANMGIITFDSSGVSASGTGTGSAIGNFNLTTTYQTIFQKIGSGVYSENDYTIRARSPNPNRIQFEITFNDDAVGNPPITPEPPGAIVGGVDENVNGSTSSSVSILRADGDSLIIGSQTYDGVVVPAPGLITNANLATAPIPAPEPTPPPPPPPIITPTGDNAICISVIDESSPSASIIRADWLDFRSNYPNREFWLLGPLTSYNGSPREPAEYTADPLANGPVPVSVDNGNTSIRSDWFDIIGLAGKPAGTIISLSVDNSGSITTSKVQASYDFFKQQCSAAGFILLEPSMGSSERWALPHNKSLP